MTDQPSARSDADRSHQPIDAADSAPFDAGRPHDAANSARFDAGRLHRPIDAAHLAQFNVGRLREPIDAPGMAEFMALFAPVNALAEASPGFVWRLTDGEADDATSIRPYGDDVIINYSVWESRESLWNFAYRSGHLDVLRRRREWFHRIAEPYQVLWWIPAHTTPTVTEALDRMTLLRAEGPSPAAFTFREAYEPDGSLAGGQNA